MIYLYCPVGFCILNVEGSNLTLIRESASKPAPPLALLSFLEGLRRTEHETLEVGPVTEVVGPLSLPKR